MTRTPDEIKKGLECCLFGQCGICPYSEEYGCDCSEHLRDDIREYHNHLEAEIDAAVEALKNGDVCDACKHFGTRMDEEPCAWCSSLHSNFEWRGVQKEE